MGSHRGPSLELGQDAIRELLSELDPPLVERVDAPDRTHDEDPMLVERDDRAERSGVEAVIEERRRWAVARERLVFREQVEIGTAHSRLDELLARFGLGLAAHQRFG